MEVLIMKAPADMTNEQLINWMTKTNTTLGNFAHGQKSYTEAFSDKLESLKYRWEIMKDEMYGRGLWAAWCQQMDMPNDVNSGDLCC